MKVSKQVSAAHRNALLAAAGRLFREKGFDGVGIAEIAAAADLTHGAFYTHFASKEALCAEVLDTIVRGSARVLQDAGDMAGFIDAYLSPKHLRNRAGGCAMAALGVDAARGGDAVRAAFSSGLEAVIDAFAAQPGTDRQRAIATVAALVGGLVLARAAEGRGFREEILDAVRMSLPPR